MLNTRWSFTRRFFFSSTSGGILICTNLKQVCGGFIKCLFLISALFYFTHCWPTREFLCCSYSESCYSTWWSGGFFLACENFWTMFDHSVSICIFLSGFFKWRLAPAHKFHFLSQDQPTVALQAEMTVSTIAATPPIMAIVPYYFRCYSTNTSNNPNISWRSIPYNLSHQCKASTK